MDFHQRIETALKSAMATAQSPAGPPLLQEALSHAVFPGGARVRPRLCLAVAAACGDPHPVAADAIASSIEFMHCASLVHDDLPCFDNAAIRRGKPSVQAKFGERIAVLAGDALIVLAYDTVARRTAHVSHLLPAMVMALSRAVGMPSGIVAGQSWECETQVDLSLYQQQKTGALFSGATMAGAAAAGYPAEPWRELGNQIGEAFQIADDILDATGTCERIGKPVGQDIALDRPSAVRQLGLPGAVRRLRSLVDDAVSSVPQCPGREALQHLVRQQAMQFIPAEVAQVAA